MLNSAASFARTSILYVHVPYCLRCMPVLINMPDDKITTVHFNKKDERYKNITLPLVLYKGNLASCREGRV